ncbi:hypothetical protein ACHAXT_012839 [Thalassiosira profunda]
MCRRVEAAEPSARYRRIGDAAHVALLAAIVAYAADVSRLMQGRSPWLSFDSEWTRDGFCMPHDEVPLLTTHERSGFFMIAMSLLGFGLMRILKDETGRMDDATERVKWALVGAIGHASGHFILAVTKRNGLLPSGEVSAMDEFLAEDCNWVTFAKHIPGYFLFWIPLVKTYMYNVSSNSVALFAFVVNVLGMQMPLKFGFSYTLIVLFAGQALDQLFLPRCQKGFEYRLWPLITLLPNFILSVLESQLCTGSEVFRTHGHLIFDGYMAASYSAYYFCCWLWNRGVAKAEKVA